MTLLPSSLPLIYNAYYYGTPLVAAGAVIALYSLFQRCRPAQTEREPELDRDVIRDPALAEVDRVEEAAQPIFFPSEEDVGALGRADDAPTVIIPELTGFKKVAFDIAILAPKLFFSGMGWLIGNAIAPVIGAGLGDAIGTFIGCLISLGIEIAIMKYRNDPNIDSSDKLKDFIKLRLIQAGILTIGCFAGGAAFSFMTETWGKIVHPNSLASDLLVSLLAGLTTSSYFGIAHLLARAFLYRSEQFGFNRRNVIQDSCTTLGIIWPAKTAISKLNSFNTYGSPLLAGASSVIGGVAGYFIGSIAEKIMEKIMEEINRIREQEAEKSIVIDDYLEASLSEDAAI